MIIITGTVHIKSERWEEAVSSVRELIEKSRADEGCVRYTFSEPFVFSKQKAPKVILVVKSKTRLFLNLRAFIPSGKLDFATRIESGQEPERRPF